MNNLLYQRHVVEGYEEPESVEILRKKSDKEREYLQKNNYTNGVKTASRIHTDGWIQKKDQR